MKRTVEVTEEHIEKGRARECEECPVAYAIKDMVKTGVNVHVHGYEVEFAFDGGYKTAEMPKIAAAFINVFDDPTLPGGSGKRHVGPVRFDLDFPPGVLK